MRRSLRRLEVDVTVVGQSITIECPAGAISDEQRGQVASLLRQQVHQLQLSLLTSCQDQGRPFTLLSKSSVSNSWISNGKYMSFSDYRFAIKARCNLLPVRSVQKRIGLTSHNQCTRCTSNHISTCSELLSSTLWFDERTT